MANFWGGFSGWQKLILIFGLIVTLIAVRVLFPEEAQWLVDSIRGLFESIGHFFGDIGHTE